MTVEQLKKALEGLPPEMRVVMLDKGDGWEYSVYVAPAPTLSNNGDMVLEIYYE